MCRDHELSFDFAACDGHGLCAELLSELIGLDEWGYPVLQDVTVPAPARPRPTGGRPMRYWHCA